MPGATPGSSGAHRAVMGQDGRMQGGEMVRRVLLVTHTGRGSAVEVSTRLTRSLMNAGIEVFVPHDDHSNLDARPIPARTEIEPGSAGSAGPSPVADLIVAVGGDGTILRASEYAYEASIPLLGLNLGHVGFLAEAESDAVESVAEAVIARSYRVEERMTLRVQLLRDDVVQWEDWALNEAAISKREAEGMIDVLLEVDGRPLSRWGCDGVVVATPTGSTAYTWSVGGPVVWPEVRALLVAPISAHALFARSLVVDPGGEVALEMSPSSQDAEIWCDGQRSYVALPGDRVEVTVSERPFRFARLRESDFTDRLVAKFRLPVDGWRGRPQP